MIDREEREKVIEILQKEKKTALHDNRWAFDYAISSIETDIKYDLLYEETIGQADKTATKNDSSGLDKNSKKLEKDFGESDCISRQATVKRLCVLAEFLNEHKENSGVPYIMAALFIQDNKTEFPAVTPQEPKTGHWDDIPKYKDIAWQCSECGHFTTMKHNFCADCGCRMVEPQESEESDADSN